MGIILRWKNFLYMLEIDILRNYCRIEINQWFNLPLSEWVQFGMIKVGNIVPNIYSVIPVIRILTFYIGFSE